MNRREKALIITIAANFLLIALKFALAWLSGSLALKASAWHSFSDIFVSGIVLTGLFMTRREDLKRSRGISRIENFVSIIVSFFILYIGYEIFQEVVRGAERELAQVPTVSLGALLTIVTSYFMARYKIYVRNKTNSPSLIADGYHSKMDMYSSMIVVIGLIGYQVGLVNTDKVAAVIIVILIAWTGLEIFMGALRALRAGGLLEIMHEHRFPWGTGRFPPWVKKLGVLPLVGIYFASGIYYVKWDQVAIEKRFGKPIDIAVPPGLHYRLPWPVASVEGVVRGVFILFGLAVVIALIVNYFSAAGVPLFGEWDTLQGVVSPAYEDDALGPESLIDNVDLAKEIFYRGEVLFVDARPREVYEEGHIKGAVSLPVGQFDILIDEFMDQYPTDTPVVIYCSGRRCKDSHLLAQYLLQVGYERIKVLIDGYPGWEEEGYPVE
ncbi:MAG: cation diffusion facilitator family transporter [Deltaproteobacteria bacterium]|nr:cation diffusion facilitator family transporter [Deltaproteobacteria bacterium]